MSAYIVSDETISGMLSAIRFDKYDGMHGYYFNGEWLALKSNEKVIGQKLVDENYRSVNYRYSDNTEPHVFQKKHVLPSQVEIIKLCACYDYQSCETDDWEKTEAHAIMTGLRELAITSLPGYEEATWGWGQ